MTLRLVADDLTGALDTAAQFCSPSAGVPVLPLLPDDLAPFAGSPVALNLASREASRDVAREAAARCSSFLAGGDPAFKKVDSLLRGPWAAELAATLPAGFASCVLAPAFPAQGRVTRGCRQFAPSDTGSLEAVGDPLREYLAAEGLALAGDAPPRPGLPPVHVFDARTQADLDQVVARGRTLPGPVLWCGSAGLAAALAGGPPRTFLPAPPAGSSLLVVIGTDHPVTRRQLATLLDRPGPEHIVLGPRPDIDERKVRSALPARPVILTVDVPRPCDRPSAARLIRDRLFAVLPRLDAPAALLVVGGETLLAVCEALEVGSLSVLGQYAPGIPVSEVSRGPWAGTRIFSKSGAFGGPDLLASMVFG